MPLNNGGGHANHIHSLHPGILDLQQWVPNPPISLTTSIQDQLSDTSLEKSVPSYDLYSPFHIEEPWDLNFLEVMEDIPLPSIPSNHSLDCSFLASNSSLATRSDSIPTEPNQNISSSLLEPTKALEPRNLMPKPPSLPFDAMSDTNSGNVIQQGSARQNGRRRSNARMRQIGSCARCIVRKLKVRWE